MKTLEYPGIWLYTNGILNCTGTATSPDCLVQYNTVQEQSNTNWETTNWIASVITPFSLDTSSVNCAFTEWSVFADSGQIDGEMIECPVGVQNCQFYGGQINIEGSGPVLSATNCLFQRVDMLMTDRSIGNVSPSFYNNLFLEGSLTNVHVNTGEYTYRDNLFDQTAVDINLNHGGKYIDICSNNAYVTTNNGVLSPENNDVILTASPAYEVGPLGENYYPTDSPLINAGSQSAVAAGLAFYTVLTNNTIDGANMVSIGYHYLDVGVGANGQPVADNLPDSWQLEYFGVIGLDANADFDGTTSIANAYANGTDPNVVAFNPWVSNRWVNITNVPLQLAVTAGVPFSMAALLDNTNFSAATWVQFNSNLTVNLGTAQGWHTVWIGARGYPTNAQQTWNAIRLNLNVTPPILAITNPLQGLVSVPYIQVQGYSLEELGSIYYDLSNSIGIQTNQAAFVTTRQFSTNLFDYTTNGFQCFNVPLATGINTITLHAIDWAGNITITNLTYDFEPAANTNPPVLTLGWPQNGIFIAGTNFQGFGSVSDPFASVTAQIICDGTTNARTAVVEMNGAFWLQNLPLYGGTNYLIVTATNGAGSAATNIAVIQSDEVLTIESVTFDPSSETATVTGMIGDTNEVVLVNGVIASNDGSSNWTAQYVPVGSSGTASISADATEHGIPELGDGQVETNAQLTGGATLSSYKIQLLNNYINPTGPGTYDHYGFTETYDYGAPGGETQTDCSGGEGGQWFFASYDTWGPYGSGIGHDVDTNICGDQTFINTYIWGPDFPASGRSIDVASSWDGPPQGNETYQAQTDYILKTGGQETSPIPNIWIVSILTPTTENDDGSFAPLAPSMFTVDGQTFDSYGNADLLLPWNAQVDITPHSGSSDYYTYGISANPYLPQIQANGITLDPVVTNATFCVGQQIKLDIRGFSWLTEMENG